MRSIARWSGAVISIPATTVALGSVSYGTERRARRCGSDEDLRLRRHIRQQWRLQLRDAQNRGSLGYGELWRRRRRRGRRRRRWRGSDSLDRRRDWLGDLEAPTRHEQSDFVDGIVVRQLRE